MSVQLLKNKSIVFSFRAPLDTASQIVQYAEKNSVSVSRRTFELWQKELENIEKGKSNGRKND